MFSRPAAPRRTAPRSVDLMGTGFRYFFDRILLYGLEYFHLYYGIYRARVVSNEDPNTDGMPDPFGRLTVYVPAIGDAETVKRVAWPVSSAAGNGFGFKNIPPNGSNVYVAFEMGRADAVLWLGGWWPDGAIPAELNKTETHWWITPGGHQIILDEQEGGQVIKIQHMDGSTRLEMDNDGNVFIVNKSGSKIHVGDGAENQQPLQPGVLGEKLKGLMEDLIDAIKAMTVPTPVGPSETAINFA
ncbi:MAG: hypothetical protein JRG69_06920, partial [Deltaproteobacteria bacterium]|nr:hypothetical protein [Deltaproteobacteria bacterium]